jgi:hypothetical protein
MKKNVTHAASQDLLTDFVGTSIMAVSSCARKDQAMRGKTKPKSRTRSVPSKPDTNGVAAKTQIEVFPFSEEEVLRDWQWIFDQCNAGNLRKYFDQHIAVVDRKILGHTKRAIDLRSKIAKKHGLHPERVVIFWVG